MNDARIPAPSPALRLAGLGFVALALTLGVIAGCGGSKTDTTDNTSIGTTPTSAPVTPAPDTSASAPTAGANEPAAVLGPRVFAVRCALCHGADGHGDGVGAKALNPKPRNFHDKAYMSSRTDAQLLEVIHKGKGAMPKWGGVLSEAEINAVLQHVRTLGEKP
jgi:mono/diheme cytochrome c family protein